MLIFVFRRNLRSRETEMAEQYARKTDENAEPNAVPIGDDIE